MTEALVAKDFDPEAVKLIKSMCAKGTNDQEFSLYMYLAKKYELDPMTRQIWCVKYGTAPAAIFTGRDGFLSIAHRSGKFNGMQSDAIRKDNMPDGALVGARCTVWRTDMTNPFVVEVSLKEYNTGKSNWVKMPETMIKKVAESQCLRRAFDISGLYAPEEMDNVQATPASVVAPAPQRKPVAKTAPAKKKPAAKKPGTITEDQRQDLYAVAQGNDYTDEQFKALVIKHGFQSSADITEEKYEAIVNDAVSGPSALDE